MTDLKKGVTVLVDKFACLDLPIGYMKTLKSEAYTEPVS